MSRIATLAIVADLLGKDFPRMLSRDLPFCVGVSSAKPDDPDRKRKADERRARRQAARPNAKIYVN